MIKEVSCHVLRGNRSFCIKMRVPNMALGRIEKLGEVFSSLAEEVFGRKIGKVWVKPFRVHRFCKFYVEMKEEVYDTAFMYIIIMNLADASVAVSYFKDGISIPNESKRIAKMCFALYMDRNKEEMNKIKNEYAEIC